TGTCFPPIAAEFSYPLKIAGVAAGAAPPPPPPAPARVDAIKPDSGTCSDLSAGGNWLDRISCWFIGHGLFRYPLMAFVGGFIMNLMPCVLPVISIKILSFVKQAHHHRWRVFALGATFSAGIIVFFMTLGALVLVAEKSWGVQFQEPRVVIGLAAV